MQTKPYNEVLMQKLITEANGYLDKMEALLSLIDKQMAETAKKAA